MKTKDNAIHFRVSDDFIVILENCWRFLKRDYPTEYSKANDLKSFISKQLNLVNLLFNGEEAELVKTVLGNEPAQKLLAMCKKENG